MKWPRKATSVLPEGEPRAAVLPPWPGWGFDPLEEICPGRRVTRQEAFPERRIGKQTTEHPLARWNAQGCKTEASTVTKREVNSRRAVEIDRNGRGEAKEKHRSHPAL